MRAEAKINLTALQHNFSIVKKSAPVSKVIAMIKSNAYGHGLIPIAKALPDANAFGVACVSEAVALRQADIMQSIVLMSGFNNVDELGTIDQYQLDFVIHEKSQLEILKKHKLKHPTQIWLKMDTGMHRLGFLPEDIDFAMNTLSQCQNIKQPINVMTHLANADIPENQCNQNQIDCFKKAIQPFDIKNKSISNSAAILSMPETHVDYVRPGIMLYGISPFSGKTGTELNLNPVMTLRAKLIAIHQLQKGDAIGYGSTWQCSENMPMGVISIGYGDGYPRHADDTTPILINDTVCKLAGRVSMDMITVDLRNAPDAKVGDIVTLWGDGLPIEQVAAAAETIAYELVCNISQRVEFIYE